MTGTDQSPILEAALQAVSDARMPVANDDKKKDELLVNNAWNIPALFRQCLDMRVPHKAIAHLIKSQNDDDIVPCIDCPVPFDLFLFMIHSRCKFTINAT